MLQPPNDEFDNATVVTSLPFTDSLSTNGATTSLLEPQPSCVPLGHMGKTVWYRYTPPDDARLDADTFGSDFDTVLAVYTGDPPTLSPVACNDDSRASYQSRTVFDVEADVTYYFQIGGYLASSGTLVFDLDVFLPPVPPANDDFDDAAVIAAVPATDTVNTEAATTEAEEPQPSCAESTGRTVWYRYTPTEDEELDVNTFGSDFDTVLAVYAGDGLAALDEVTCNDQTDWSSQSRVFLEAEAGVTYHVQVGGWFDDAGDLVFAIGPWTGGPPDPDPEPWPGFHDYVQPVWFEWDTTNLDVLVLGADDPVIVAAIREAIAAWEAGIAELAPAWLADSLRIRVHVPTLDVVVPPADFEPNIFFVPQGFFAVDPGSGDHQTCYAFAPMPWWGGEPVPYGSAYRVASHEFGHCLGLHHVFEHGIEYSPAFDVMGLGVHPDGHKACPSNLNVLVLERVFGELHGSPGGGEVAISPDDYYQSSC